jgi:nondiscriminating glutamyl-tRNA synthetase
MTVRTRFAPSPTGRLHLGNVRTAVFNWLFARHHGGKFVLRVEDTDVERNVAGAEAGLLEDLRWLGLEWDEGPDVGGPRGPYRQSERVELHRAHARQLLLSGAAYECFAPEEEALGPDRRYPGTFRDLDPSEARRRVEAGEPHVVRLRTPLDGEVVIEDEVRGNISFPAEDIDDFVILRSDGRPTYNFGVVVDDLLMGITHVIRGAGHLSNTPKQLLLWRAFEAAPPAFAHLPDVLAPDGGKLSKRSGAQAVAELREAGALPAAIVNYLSLLGWSHPDEREILTREELIEAVDLDRVGAADTRFDPDKMRWVGQQHVARLSEEEVVRALRPRLEAAGLEGEPLRWVAGALRSRLATFGEVEAHLDFLTVGDADRQAAVAAAGIEGDISTLFDTAAVYLGGLDDWEPGAVKAAIASAGKAVGRRGRALFVPLRLATTGQEHGPDLATLLAALGRDEAIRRLRTATIA